MNTDKPPTAEEMLAAVEREIDEQYEVIEDAVTAIALHRETIRAARAEIKRLALMRPRKPRGPRKAKAPE